MANIYRFAVSSVRFFCSFWRERDRDRDRERQRQRQTEREKRERQTETERERVWIRFVFSLGWLFF